MDKSIKYQIIESDYSYLNQIANLHNKYYSEGLTSLLGINMIKALFKLFIDSPLGILLIAVSDEKVLGYVAGSVDRDQFWRSFLLNKFFTILWYGIHRLLQNFPLIKLGFKKLQTIFRIPEKGKEGWTITEIPKASLMWIAVDKYYRNKGIGYRLTKKFLNALRRKGCARVKLGVSLHNSSAIRTYLKSGWEIVFTGEKSLILIAKTTNP